MSSIKELNKFDKKLRELCRNKTNKKHKDNAFFYHSTNEFFLKLLKYSKEIIKEENINIYRLNIKEKTISNILNFNTSDWDEKGDLVNEKKRNLLIEYLKLSEKHNNLNSTNSFQSTTKANFQNAEISEEDLEYLEDIPNFDVSYVLKDIEEKTDYGSLLMNLWIDNNIIYAFKNTGEAKYQKSGGFQTIRLSVVQKIGEVDIVTCHESTCNAQNETIGSCGRVVTWCDVHESSNIKCTNDLPGVFDGHKINTSGDGVRTKRTRTIYIYEGYDLNDTSDTKESIYYYSLIPLTHETIRCNCVDFYDAKNRVVYPGIISIEDKRQIILKEPIIKDRDKKTFLFLDDMYENIKKYLKEYNDIILTNQNRIIGKYIIFQLLVKLVMNKRFDSLIAGTSGSGKTVWSQYLVPLFTHNFEITYGTQVTRNRLMGGRSNISMNGTSIYSHGFWAISDIVFLEESTDALSDFIQGKQNKFIDLSNNIFSLHKIASSGGNIGIQGSKRFVPNACSVFVGNLEQLEWMGEYEKKVRKKYYNYTNNSLNNKIPLFRPSKWYKDFCNDEELAKAHLVIRAKLSRNFFTNLPVAEQSRFAFLIYLEDVEGKQTNEIVMNEYQENVNKNKLFHRREMNDEIKEIFRFTEREAKIWEKVKKQIFNWMQKEYIEKEPNNFKIYKNDKVNIHLSLAISYVAIYLIKLHKQYVLDRDKDVEEQLKFTEDDKNRIRYFLRFNYNSLSLKEASEIVKPYLQTEIEFDSQEVVEHDDTKKREYYESVLRKEEDDKTLESGQTFSNENKNVFDE